MDQENKHLTFFKNLTIKHKLIANNILLIVTIIFLAIFSSFKLSKIGGMLNDTTGKITDITEISKFITEIEALVSNTALQAMVGSEFDPAEAKGKNDEYLVMCMDRIKGIAQKSTIENSLKSYQESSNKFYGMIIEGNYLEAADVATKELNPLMQTLKEESDRIVTASINATSERNKELKEHLRTNIIFISLASLIAIIISAIIAIYVILSISSGLKDVIDRLKDIAKGDGDLTKKLSDSRNDELGELARWFNRFVDKIQGIVQEVASHASTLSQSSFDLSTSSNQLASNAEEMSTQSNIVASSTEQTSSNIESIASFAEEMSTSVNTVASAIEELSASLNEVAKNCQKESQIALQADTQAKNTRSQMGHLDDAAKEIGKVIDTINDIADQTNLLALNATIEAASAGEAGSGFAVVANEVKELAKQTAQATSIISTQIEQIQSIANGSVLSIQEIAAIIDEVNTISQTIVASVEEQSATVNEISNNTSGASKASNDIACKVQESASSMKEVSSNIQGVNVAAQDTTKGVQQIKVNVDELATLAGRLNKVVEQFKI